MSRALWPVLFLLVAACAPAQTPEAEKTEAPPEGAPEDLTGFLRERGYETVPLDRLPSGHFSVRARTEAAPLRLVVDTGAGRTVLDRDWALQAGIALAEQQGTATGLGGTGQGMALGTLRDVEIGPVALDTLRVAVLDLSHVNVGLRRARQMPIQGIIGADFLHAHEAILDYRGPTLFVRTR